MLLRSVVPAHESLIAADPELAYLLRAMGGHECGRMIGKVLCISMHADGHICISIGMFMSIYVLWVRIPTDVHMRLYIYIFVTEKGWKRWFWVIMFEVMAGGQYSFSEYRRV